MLFYISSDCVVHTESEHKAMLNEELPVYNDDIDYEAIKETFIEDIDVE